jgi:iron complex outermembrane receptor protein
MRRLSAFCPTRPQALTHLALAALLCTHQAAQAQTVNSTDQADATLPTVSVTAQAKRQARATIAGLGDAPAWQLPVQAQSYTQDALKDAQVTRLADLTKLDASTSDAYNTVGYWDYLSIRGFTLDNAYNFRREGLPINAETRIALDNKASVELLKGTSGIQAGVSAPGGLVNLLVKRPEGRVRSALVSVDDSGDLLTSVDLGDRLGERKEWGLRVNAAIEKLNTHVDNTQGHRRLLAVATDYVIAPGHVIEAEFEHSLTSQPSVPGMSLLGGQLPSVKAFSSSLNLNNQPWTQPVQLMGDTGTVRLKNDLGQGWQSTVTYGEQHLKSNDRAAFPFGCSSANDYTSYCADGSYDLYDYRSDNERRVTRALLAQLQGQVQTGSLRHDLTLGVLRSVYGTDIQAQAYNWVDYGSVYDAYRVSPSDATFDDASTNRHERSTEWSAQDAIQITADWQAWVGLRHTSLRRESVKTDGSEDTRLQQAVNTPWTALAYTFAPLTRAYISWGEGSESKAAPSNTSLSNAGQVMPTLKSRQLELGVKGQYNAPRLSTQWGTNWFHIRRPEASTIDNVYQYDGQSTHQGLEAYWQGRSGPWAVSGSVMVLDAKRLGSATDSVNGKHPVNVPADMIKLSGAYTLGNALPLTVQADLVHEGRRWVDADNTIHLPAWTRTDLSVRTNQNWDGNNITWRLGVTNLFDVRAWREAPTSFGHVYLFPLAQRTVTASAQIDF